MRANHCLTIILIFRMIIAKYRYFSIEKHVNYKNFIFIDNAGPPIHMHDL